MPTQSPSANWRQIVGIHHIPRQRKADSLWQNNFTLRDSMSPGWWHEDHLDGGQAQKIPLWGTTTRPKKSPLGQKKQWSCMTTEVWWLQGQKEERRQHPRLHVACAYSRRHEHPVRDPDSPRAVHTLPWVCLPMGEA